MSENNIQNNAVGGQPGEQTPRTVEENHGSEAISQGNGAQQMQPQPQPGQQPQPEPQQPPQPQPQSQPQAELPQQPQPPQPPQPPYQQPVFVQQNEPEQQPYGSSQQPSGAPQQPYDPQTYGGAPQQENMQPPVPPQQPPYTQQPPMPPQPLYQEAPAAQMSDQDETLRLIAFIFMVISCVGVGLLVVPLAWMIPMTVHAWYLYKGQKPNSIGFDVCTLIFVNLVSGVLLLCSTRDK